MSVARNLTASIEGERRVGRGGSERRMRVARLGEKVRKGKESQSSANVTRNPTANTATSVPGT